MRGCDTIGSALRSTGFATTVVRGTQPLTQGPEHSMAEYRIDPLIIDSENYSVVTEDGDVVHVTPKVFDALLLFCQERNRVLTKEELMRRLWPDTHVTESSLFKVIQEIRKLLSDAGCEGMELRNIPARGYVLSGAVGDASNDEVSDWEPIEQPSEKGPTQFRLWLGALILVLLGLVSWVVLTLEPSTLNHQERQQVQAMIKEAPDAALEVLNGWSSSTISDAMAWWHAHHLGVAHLQLGHLDQAQLAFERALESPELGIDQRLKSTVQLATVFDQKSMPQRAIAILEPALELDKDRTQFTALSLALANAYQDSGQLDEATAIHRSLLEHATKANNESIRQRALGSLGNIAYRTGDRAQAIEYFEAALDVALSQSDSMSAGRLQGNLANLFQQNADYQTAARYYAQAYSLMAESMEVRQAAILVVNFANTYMEAGKFTVAEYYYDRLVAWAEQRGFKLVSWTTQLNSGIAAYRQQKLTEAEVIFTKLLAETESAQAMQFGGYAASYLARTLALAEKPLQALELANDSLQIAEQTQDHEILIFSLLAKARAHLELNTYAQSVEALEHAVELCGDRIDWERLEVLELAVLAYAANNDMGNAQSAQQQAVALRRQLEAAREAFVYRPNQPLQLPGL